VEALRGWQRRDRAARRVPGGDPLEPDERASDRLGVGLRPEDGELLVIECRAGGQEAAGAAEQHDPRVEPLAPFEVGDDPQ